MNNIQTAQLIIGRFQPPHLGHIKIIKLMKNPICVIVKGGKTSLEKERNPLDSEYQEKLLKMCIPNLKVNISPNGYLPGILGFLRKEGYEIDTVYAGEDRLSDYKKMLDVANSKMPEEQKYKVVFKESERFTSATKVRESIRSGNFEEFKKLVPKEIWDEWKTLQEKLKLQEELDSIGYIISFKEWLNEIESNFVTGTLNITNVDKPLALVRRNKSKIKKSKKFKKNSD